MIGKPIRIDREAEDEIAGAIDWYEARRDGLGRKFLDEVRRAIASLSIPGPECRPALNVRPDLGVKRRLVDRFPYVVFFVEMDDVVRGAPGTGEPGSNAPRRSLPDT